MANRGLALFGVFGVGIFWAFWLFDTLSDFFFFFFHFVLFFHDWYLSVQFRLELPLLSLPGVTKTPLPFPAILLQPLPLRHRYNINYSSLSRICSPCYYYFLNKNWTLAHISLSMPFLCSLPAPITFFYTHFAILSAFLAIWEVGTGFRSIRFPSAVFHDVFWPVNQILCSINEAPIVSTGGTGGLNSSPPPHFSLPNKLNKWFSP